MLLLESNYKNEGDEKKKNTREIIKGSQRTYYTYILCVVVPLIRSVEFQFLLLAKLELTC
jgi:hypothetical protein